MTQIPQRELRNQISAILRRAQAGEHFTVTVDGRPVAALGPIPVARPAADPERLAAVLGRTPVDGAWASELRELRANEVVDATDPWV